MNSPLTGGSMSGFHFLIEEVIAQHLQKSIEEFRQTNKP